MAKRTYDVIGPWDDEDGDFTERWNRETEALNLLLEHSRSLPEGEVEGAVLKFQKGDGWAFYRVEKEHPLTLAWIPFGDQWAISDAELRGLNLQDVRAMVDSSRRMAAIFGQSKQQMRED